jgi:hypothetical protein
MGAALTKVLSDRQLQQRMMEAGLQQAQRFHPDAVQREVQDFWNGLAMQETGEQAAFFSVERETAVVEPQR